MNTILRNVMLSLFLLLSSHVAMDDLGNWKVEAPLYPSILEEWSYQNEEVQFSPEKQFSPAPSFQGPVDWNLNIKGFSPAYFDKAREAIAVNTVEQPTDKWAAATTLFEHSSGVYTIRFTSLLESDGECSYILRIGGKKMMDFQNPSIYGKDIEEYAPHVEEVKNIFIEKGNLIRVEFLPHSNGLVPEGDGFGFARARWKGNIEFILQQEK